MNCFPGHVRGDSQGRVLCGHQAPSRKLLSHVIGPDRCVMGMRGNRAPVLRRPSALTGSTRDPRRPLAHPEAQPITGASAGAEVPGELLGQGVWARGAVRTRSNTAQHPLGAWRTRPARTRKAGGKGTQSRGENARLQQHDAALQGALGRRRCTVGREAYRVGRRLPGGFRCQAVELRPCQRPKKSQKKKKIPTTKGFSLLKDPC